MFMRVKQLERVAVATKTPLRTARMKTHTSVHALSLSLQAVSGPSVNYLKSDRYRKKPRHKARVLDYVAL